jgi:hypothetical protein
MQYFVVVLALIKVDFLNGKNLIWWPWPLTLNINRFQILLRTKYVPSLVKVHWRMLILECSQGYYDTLINLHVKVSNRSITGYHLNTFTIRISRRFSLLCSKNLTRWPRPLTLKIIGFQILLRTKYVSSLVKIHWWMLILECSQECYGRTEALLYPFATSLASIPVNSPP